MCSPETIGVAPAAEGLQMVGGDFFKSSTLPKGDVYLMKVSVREWVCVCVRELFVGCRVALWKGRVALFSHHLRVNEG